MITLTTANVLITGGSEGIGLGLATRFLEAGSKVMITGRSAGKLERAAAAFPGLQTLVNDIGIPAQRALLAMHIRTNMPQLNVVINNAGIQRRVSLAADHADWQERQAEIDILLSAPIHLNHLLLPGMLQNGGEGLIVNVTSGGAYIPQVFAPVYSACKAALHSYTMSLRHSLAGTGINVVEVIPPAVQTSLAGPGLNHGVLTDEFCDAVFASLTSAYKAEVGFGPTAGIEVTVSGQPVKELFKASAARFPIATYTTPGAA